MDANTVLSFVGVILILAVLLPFIQGARRKATLELVNQELAIEREAREEQEKRCRAQIAQLSGRLDLVTSDFARIIAKELVSVMRDEGVIPRKD